MRTCKVCNSPHVEEYNRMRFQENRDIKEIWMYAKQKYNEPFSYYSLRRHFQHVKREMDYLKRSSKLRQKIVEEEIKRDIVIAEQLRRNLEICAKHIEKYASKDQLTREEEKSLINFIHQSNLIIEELLKWGKQLKLQPKTENIFERIMYCMRDFPPELLAKFEERWNSYESE